MILTPGGNVVRNGAQPGKQHSLLISSKRIQQQLKRTPTIKVPLRPPCRAICQRGMRDQPGPLPKWAAPPSPSGGRYRHYESGQKSHVVRFSAAFFAVDRAVLSIRSPKSRGEDDATQMISPEICAQIRRYWLRISLHS